MLRRELASSATPQNRGAYTASKNRTHQEGCARNGDFSRTGSGACTAVQRAIGTNKAHAVFESRNGERRNCTHVLEGKKNPAVAAGTANVDGKHVCCQSGVCAALRRIRARS